MRSLPYTTFDRVERAAALRRIEPAVRREQAVTAGAASAVERLNEYRSSLIHEAVSGKLDIARLSEQQIDERLHAAVEGRLNEVAV